MKIAVPAVLIPIAVALLYAFVPGVREQPWNATRIFGVILAGAGYGLLLVARIQLGSSFSVRPEAGELVTHGLYSRFRNPMYVFLDVMLCGLILVFGWPWLLVIVAALAFFQSIQASREAMVLEQKFGQAYLDYRRHTWL
jgi:protein-S-isoprenylcysteine O-methyltransferase Ste14